METPRIRTGSCQCGKVQFQTSGALRPVVFCHCKQCRKSTGHFMAATASLMQYFTLTKNEGLAWYASSDKARRGFCNACGSTLFWQQNGAPQISIAAGSFDDDSDFVAWGHIFSSAKGHYYQIDNDELQCEEKPQDFPTLK